MIENDAPTPAHRWALALAAIPIQQRNGRFDWLGGLLDAKPSRSEARGLLRALASIHDADDLRARLDQIEHGGAVHVFTECRAWAQSLPKVSATTGFYVKGQEYNRSYTFAFEHIDFEPETLLAFDAGRLVQNAGLAVRAGYLDATTAWQRIAAMARRVQAQYTSWRAFADGYLRGRWFYAGYWDTYMDQAEQVITALFARRDGPFNIAWNTPLDALDSALEIAPKPNAPERPLACVTACVSMDCPQCLQPLALGAVVPIMHCPHCRSAIDLAALRPFGLIASAFGEDEEGGEDDKERRRRKRDQAALPDSDAMESTTNLDDLFIARARYIARAPRCNQCHATLDPDALANAAPMRQYACPSCVSAMPVRSADEQVKAIDLRIVCIAGESIAHAPLSHTPVPRCLGCGAALAADAHPIATCNTCGEHTYVGPAGGATYVASPIGASAPMLHFVFRTSAREAQ